MSEQENRSFLEAAGGVVEAFIDAATENELLASVPVFGTAVRLLQTRDNMRARAFAAKLKRFLDGVALSQDSEKLKAKIAADPEEAQRIGETLFLVLERITDLEKATFLAKLFTAYIDDVIDGIQLRRLAQALDGAFPDDIQQLILSDDIDPSYKPEWKENLSGSGLTRVQVNDEGVYGDYPAVTFYEVSPLGKLMRRALNNVPSMKQRKTGRWGKAEGIDLY